MMKATIAIIGAGHMGSALLFGLIAEGYPEEKIWVANLGQEKLDALSKKTNIHLTQDNKEALSHAEIVIFAVKPVVLPSVVQSLSEAIQKHKPLMISVAAGVREKELQTWCGGAVSIVRAMPNTPSLLRCGATALFANAFVSHEHRNKVESIFRAIGVIEWVEDEKWLDVVTALSGSGPAYFFLLMEALQKAAVECGLPLSVARLLTLQTAYGSARMALNSDEEVSVLRQQVTSKGGTTEKAIDVLEQNHWREIIKNAMLAGVHRAEEIATMFEAEGKK